MKLEEKNEELRTKIVNLEKKNEKFQSSLQEEKEDIHKQMKFTMTKVLKLEKESELTRNLASTGSLEWKISEVKKKSHEIGTHTVIHSM